MISVSLFQSDESRRLTGWAAGRWLFTPCYALINSSGYHKGQQSSRWWVYQVLCLSADMIPWTNCPLQPKACRAIRATQFWSKQQLYSKDADRSLLVVDITPNSERSPRIAGNRSVGIKVICDWNCSLALVLPCVSSCELSKADQNPNANAARGKLVSKTSELSSHGKLTDDRRHVCGFIDTFFFR